MRKTRPPQRELAPEDSEISSPVTRLANALLVALIEYGADELTIAPEGGEGDLTFKLVGPNGVRRRLPLEQATRGEIDGLPRLLWPALAAHYVEMTLEERLRRPGAQGIGRKWEGGTFEFAVRWEPGGGPDGGETLVVKIVQKKSVDRAR